MVRMMQVVFAEEECMLLKGRNACRLGAGMYAIVGRKASSLWKKCMLICERNCTLLRVKNVSSYGVIHFAVGKNVCCCGEGKRAVVGKLCMLCGEECQLLWKRNVLC
jgi:hypothetical protein